MLPQLNLPCSAVVQEVGDLNDVDDDGFAFIPGEYDAEADDRDLEFTDIGKLELIETLMKLKSGLESALEKMRRVSESEALKDAQIRGAQQEVFKASNKLNEALQVVNALLDALAGDSSSTEIVSSSDEGEMQPYVEFRIPKYLREDFDDLTEKVHLTPSEQKNVANYLYGLVPLVTLATALMAYYLNAKTAPNSALTPAREDDFVMSLMKWWFTEEPADKLVKKLHLSNKRVVV
jgi:hypothetical protein